MDQKCFPSYKTQAKQNKNSEFQKRIKLKYQLVWGCPSGSLMTCILSSEHVKVEFFP